MVEPRYIHRANIEREIYDDYGDELLRTDTIVTEQRCSLYTTSTTFLTESTTTRATATEYGVRMPRGTDLYFGDYLTTLRGKGLPPVGTRLEVIGIIYRRSHLDAELRHIA